MGLMILAGDVGGTKTNLALCEVEGTRVVVMDTRSFPSAAYPALEPLVEEFLGDRARGLTAACLGVPGPVIDEVVQVTNLPWVIDLGSLRTRLGVARLSVINDLQATAHGIVTLAADDLLVLNAGRPRSAANAALLAAGTGLGESVLFWDGRRRIPSPSEGGHADFAPHSPIEVALYEYLAAKFGHVSWERILCGPGLVNLYMFLRDTGRGEEQPSIAQRMTKEDPAAVISGAGQLQTCGLCRAALDLFVSIYGAEAGNMALRSVALAGVYLGGGIAPKIRAKLADGTFMAAFLDKGRMRPLLEEVPVFVILNDKTALLGAAYYAATVMTRQKP
jgi:glucokinase